MLLKHGISKNGPFGSYFAATPSFLAYREGPRCACKALAALELAAGLDAAARARTPLFGPSPVRGGHVGICCDGIGPQSQSLPMPKPSSANATARRGHTAAAIGTSAAISALLYLEAT